MSNPWEEIPLDDYESHMKLDSVRQLQVMNEIMKSQLNDYPVSAAMIFGVAGGNGLEHVQKDRLKRVYGVDINSSYLEEIPRRYPDLYETLKLLHIDLTKEADRLPKVDLVIANLLIEYIGYESFSEAIRQADPKYVSCVIQINAEEGWVSDSPYLHVFDRLEEVHRQMEERELEKRMKKIGYRAVKNSEHPLPNGKKLVRMDFER